MIKTFNIILLTSFALITLSCKKTVLGPEFGPLTIVEPFSVSNNNPDFSAGQKVYFKAKFDIKAQWKLEITGNTSGAKKIYQGVNTEVSISNTLWDGSADIIPSFQAEPCTALLTFAHQVDTFSLNLTIAAKRNPDLGGVLVSNFGVSKVAAVNATTGWPSDWPFTATYDGSGTTPAGGAGLAPFPTFVLPDGNNVLFIGGTPWQGTPITPYVDFMTIRAKDADLNYGSYFPLYADPNRVYFNVFMYNTNKPGTWVQYLFHEQNGATRSLNIRPDWSGWKLISVKYSDLESTDATTYQPNKVTDVQIILLSDNTPPESAIVTTAIDHMIFTHNKPFQP